LVSFVVCWCARPYFFFIRPLITRSFLSLTLSVLVCLWPFVVVRFSAGCHPPTGSEAFEVRAQPPYPTSQCLLSPSLRPAELVEGLVWTSPNLFFYLPLFVVLFLRLFVILSIFPLFSSELSFFLTAFLGSGCYCTWFLDFGFCPLPPLFPALEGGCSLRPSLSHSPNVTVHVSPVLPSAFFGEPSLPSFLICLFMSALC